MSRLPTEDELIRWFLKERVHSTARHDEHHRFFGYYFDLFVETETEVWIVEVKRSGDYRVLGQLLYYKYLYETQVGEKKPVKLICLCGECQSDLEEFLGLYNVQLIVQAK